MVAPNGASRTKADHVQLPVTIEETVNTATECFVAGAEAIHAHVRDENQKHVLDAGLYAELLAELALQVPKMHAQITTEAVGIYTPEQQRKLVRDVMPNSVSVSMKEMFSDGETPEATNFYRFAVEANIQVQHILYSPDEVALFQNRLAKGLIAGDNVELLFVLGRYTVGQNSSPDLLSPFLTAVEKFKQVPVEWAVCAFGRGETDCLNAALKSGGKVRVGFENSLWNADGSIAADNSERVKKIKALG